LDAQGHLALLQGREEQAASLLQRALSIREQALGADHPDVAQTLQHLAELSQKQGKPEQAETLYSRALAIREQVLGADHPDTIATREALDRLLVNDLKGRSSHGMRNELKVSEQ
jgi:tetratricopeptide (TPR) repeat protein